MNSLSYTIDLSCLQSNGFTLLWSKVKMSKDKNAEKINVENTGATLLALTIAHRSPPTPSSLLSTKVGFTILIYPYLMQKQK